VLKHADSGRRHEKPFRAGASDRFDRYSLQSLYALAMTLNDLEAEDLATRDVDHKFWLRVALADAIEERVARMVKADAEGEASPAPAQLEALGKEGT